MIHFRHGVVPVDLSGFVWITGGGHRLAPGARHVWPSVTRVEYDVEAECR